MKALKTILIVIVVLIAIPLIAALFVPKDFKSESEIIINQPKTQVFDYVRHLKNQDEYAKWNQIDPDMKKDYEGEDGTVGFIAYWDSEDSQVGKGEQEITNIEEGKRIDSELRFDGYDDPMLASVITENTEEENQTLVKWEAAGHMPYPFNLMSLFYNMDKDLAEGLENLKTVLEAQETAVINNKDFLLGYFEQTTEKLNENVAGLNEAQMQFKPSDTTWSISQCLEHIILTEKMLFDMAKETMGQPATPERKNEVKISDEELIAGMTDRSQKAKAPKEIQGEGKYTDPETAMSDLTEQRKAILDYIEDNPLESFRNHISDSPAGVIDAYQSFLFIAGHTARHTLQIEEVKNADGFPEEK